MKKEKPIPVSPRESAYVRQPCDPNHAREPGSSLEQKPYRTTAPTIFESSASSGPRRFVSERIAPITSTPTS